MITLIIVAVVILVLLVVLATLIIGCIPILFVLGDIVLGAAVVSAPFVIAHLIKKGITKKSKE